MFENENPRTFQCRGLTFGRGGFPNYRSGQPLEYIDFEAVRTHSFFEKVAPLYEKGLSLREISAQTGIPKTCVRQTLIDGGVTIRSAYPSEKAPTTVTRNRVGIPPYGFYWLHGKLHGERRELAIVRAIVELWQAGKNFSDIVRHLNHHKKPTRSGKPWDHSLVRRIVQRHQQNPNQYEEESK